tara:strand:- start:613 stop:837 length:225 start_codon:yes stop_codon:yes gene_type:complete
MTYLSIDCEHDMEINIEYLALLAKADGLCKVDISFPSVLLMKTFMENLFERFDEKDVPTDANLDLSVFIPKENE